MQIKPVLKTKMKNKITNNLSKKLKTIKNSFTLKITISGKIKINF